MKVQLLTWHDTCKAQPNLAHMSWVWFYTCDGLGWEFLNACNELDWKNIQTQLKLTHAHANLLKYVSWITRLSDKILTFYRQCKFQFYLINEIIVSQFLSYFY